MINVICSLWGTKYTVDYVNRLYNNDITVPNTVTLEGAYPNPFNPVTNIKFSVPERMHVEMNIIDIQGRLVDKIVQDTYDYGNHDVVYNALFSAGICTALP